MKFLFIGPISLIQLVVVRVREARDARRARRMAAAPDQAPELLTADVSW